MKDDLNMSDGGFTEAQKNAERLREEYKKDQKPQQQLNAIKKTARGFGGGTFEQALKGVGAAALSLLIGLGAGAIATSGNVSSTPDTGSSIPGISSYGNSSYSSSSSKSYSSSSSGSYSSSSAGTFGYSSSSKSSSSSNSGGSGNTNGGVTLSSGEQSFKLGSLPLQVDMKLTKSYSTGYASDVFTVSGTLKNTSSSERFNTVSVQFALYDSSGTELGTQTVYFTGMAPGNSKQFSESAFSASPKTVASATTAKIVNFSAH